MNLYSTLNFFLALIKFVEKLRHQFLYYQHVNAPHRSLLIFLIFFKNIEIVIFSGVQKLLETRDLGNAHF